MGIKRKGGNSGGQRYERKGILSAVDVELEGLKVKFKVIEVLN